jgi:hypothetical protein
MSQPITLADFYEALKQADPQAFYSSGMLGTKRWVLSRKTVHSLAAQQREPLDDDDLGLEHPYVASPGFLLGLPYRVDEKVEGFTLEDIEP